MSNGPASIESLLLFTRVLTAFTCVLLAFARVFNSSPLKVKTHANAGRSLFTLLKAHVFAISKKPRDTLGRSKVVKTHAPVHTRLPKRERLTRGSQHPGGPAIRITVYMRPRSFASPARTARTKRKRRRNEADLPVTGVGQPGLAPLNL
jgi:hypothetical protein